MTKNKNMHSIVPFIDKLQKMHDRFTAEDDKTPTTTKMRSLLIHGWDVTADMHRVDKPVDGLWRAPHIAILRGLDPELSGLRPIIASGMSKEHLLAGLWRQSWILPQSDAWRRDAVHTVQHADPFNPTAPPPPEAGELKGIKEFVSAANAKHCSRNSYFITLIGHTFEDAVEFLVELDSANPELGRLLLAKNFESAIKIFPECLALRWPDSCTSRFRDEKRKDYLPPFLVLVLFAELARHAQGQVFHNRLSFDNRGRRVGLATVRDDIITAEGGNSLPATKVMLQHKWLQSSALLAPVSIFVNRDRTAAIKWTDDCKDRILNFAIISHHAGPDYLNSKLRQVVAPSLGDEVKAAIRDFTSHPNAWPIARSDRTVTPENRQAITFHGMTWRESASVALKLIADQARSWSREYRPGGHIPDRRKDGRPPLGGAIAAITYCWLETGAPEAITGTYGSAAMRNGFAECNRLSESAEDLVGTSSPGKNMLLDAEFWIKNLPPAGNWRYSAFAHASLWFDQRHDDLSHYETLAKESIDVIAAKNASFARKAELGGLPPNVVVDLSAAKAGTASPPRSQRKTVSAPRVPKGSMAEMCSVSAKVAQAEASSFGPTATDPMHA